jgi:hypothetical protein
MGYNTDGVLTLLCSHFSFGLTAKIASCTYLTTDVCLPTSHVFCLLFSIDVGGMVNPYSSMGMSFEYSDVRDSEVPHIV